MVPSIGRGLDRYCGRPDATPVLTHGVIQPILSSSINDHWGFETINTHWAGEAHSTFYFNEDYTSAVVAFMRTRILLRFGDGSPP